MSHGARFQAIDLRWGVSEDASRQQRIMQICLEEIRRCQQVTPRPNFVVLLGERYGWRPAPETIAQSEFEAILDHVDAPGRDLITEWYVLDENAIPLEYCLRPRTGARCEDWHRIEPRLHDVLLRGALAAGLSAQAMVKFERSATEQEILEGAFQAGTDHAFAYLRDPAFMSEVPAPIRQEILGSEDTDAARELEDLKRRIRRSPISCMSDYPCAYAGLEVNWRLAGQELDAAQQRQLHDVATDGIITPPQWRKLPEDLQKAVTRCSAVRLSDLDAFIERVYADLERVITREIDRLQDIHPLDHEVEQHRKFARRRARLFFGRRHTIERILDYVRRGSEQPLVVHGRSGSGKSALMACILDKLPGNATVISRFIGATPQSTQLHSLLYTLCQQIHREFGFDVLMQRELDAHEASARQEQQGAADASEAERLRAEPDDEEYSIRQRYQIPHDPKELGQAFQRFVRLVPDDRDLVIVLDALDQLSPADNAHSLSWLPTRLPDNVRIAVSVLQREDAAGQCYRSARRRLPGEALVALPELSPDEGEAILDAWLAQEGAPGGRPREIRPRKLTARQRHDIIAGFCACTEGRGLYLRLAFEEARRWRSFDGLPTGADDVPGLNHTVDGVIHDMLARLEAPANHGTELTQSALTYLERSRNGLAEDEMLQILSADESLMADFEKRYPHSPETDTLPVVVWSRLYFDVRPYLAERSADHASLLGFYHRQVGEAVRARYLRDEPDRLRAHGKLSDYFGGDVPGIDQPNWADKKARTPNYRKMSELPWQLTHARRWRRLANALTDLDFIEAKFTAGIGYDLVEDYNRVKAGTARPGAPIRTASRHGGRLGAWCPFCRAASDIAPTQLGEVIPCPVCRSRLRINPFVIEAPWQPSAPKEGPPPPQRTIDADLSPAVHEFADFVRAEAHLLAARPHLTPQQAINSPDQTAPAQRAARLFESDDRAYIRWLNKPRLRDPCLATLEGHMREVCLCAISPDGHRIVTASVDGTVKVWHATTGAEQLSLDRLPAVVIACGFGLGGRAMVAGVAGTAVTVWDVETGQHQVTLEGHKHAVHACSFSPDGRRIVSCARDSYGDAPGEVKVWDAETGEEQFTLGPHTARLNACSFSPDGHYIVLAAGDHHQGASGELLLWDATAGQEEFNVRTHTGGVYACSFSPDGSQILAGCSDGSLAVWNVETGSQQLIWRGHTERVAGCSFSPDGRRIVSASWDMTLKVWDAPTGEPQLTLLGHTAPVAPCSFSPDGRWIVSGSADFTAKVWDAEARQDQLFLQRHITQVNACSFSPDGSRILSGAPDGAIKVWDAESGQEQLSLQGHTKWLNACSFSPDGRRIVSPSNEGTVQLWDVDNGRLQRSLGEHSSRVNTCSFSPDGRRIISGSYDGSMRVTDVETGRVHLSLHSHASGVNACSFSPDGRWLVVGSGDPHRADSGGLILLDAETGEEQLELSGHTQPVLACGFSPDGRRIVSAAGVIGFPNPGELKVWDAETGQEQLNLQAHTDFVDACSFSPDGLRIASGSADCTLRLWDAVSGQQVGVFYAAGEVRAVAVSPHGMEFLAGDSRLGLYMLRLGGLQSGAPIITPARLWLSDRHEWDSRLTALCPWHGGPFEVTTDMLARQITCPECAQPLKINGFVCDNAPPKPWWRFW